MRGLNFFRKTNSNRRFNLAYYHHPKSLTWRWIFSISLNQFCKPKFAFVKNNSGMCVGLFPLIGFQGGFTGRKLSWSLFLIYTSLEFTQQEHMWRK